MVAAKDEPSNMLAVVRRPGQFVLIRLAGGGILEIHIDHLHGDQVAMVLAVSRPLYIEQFDGDEGAGA